MKNYNASLGFIFVTILVDVIGIGIIVPVLPTLIENLTGGGMSYAAMYSGLLMFSYAIMQFIFAPILGGLSDKYGRRPILLISLFGLGLDYIFHAYAPTIFWLFIGRIFAGICGASFTTASAYIADVSPPEKKAQNFGLIGVAFGLGFIIGPVIGGVLAQWGTEVPFLAAAALTLGNMVYGYFILPESLSTENRRKFEWKRANPIGSLIHLKKYSTIIYLIVAIFIIHIAGHALQSNWTFYTMFLFDWDEAMVGYSLGFIGIMIALVQGILVRIAVPKLGEIKTVYIGFLFWFLGMILFAFANESWMMFAITIPYALGGIAGPTLQGIISNMVPDNEQGELQGSLTSLISLTSIFGPVMMTQLFYFTTDISTDFYFPGAPFALGAILLVIAFMFVKGRINISQKNE